jgi:hypothetical protein
MKMNRKDPERNTAAVRLGLLRVPGARAGPPDDQRRLSPSTALGHT